MFEAAACRAGGAFFCFAAPLGSQRQAGAPTAYKRPTLRLGGEAGPGGAEFCFVKDGRGRYRAPALLADRGGGGGKEAGREWVAAGRRRHGVCLVPLVPCRRAVRLGWRCDVGSRLLGSPGGLGGPAPAIGEVPGGRGKGKPFHCIVPPSKGARLRACA